MFDKCGLMKTFSATQVPENLHITCYLPMTEGSAAMHLCCLCIFHDVLLAEDGIKDYFSRHRRKMRQDSLKRRLVDGMHDME